MKTDKKSGNEELIGQLGESLKRAIKEGLDAKKAFLEAKNQKELETNAKMFHEKFDYAKKVLLEQYKGVANIINVYTPDGNATFNNRWEDSNGFIDGAEKVINLLIR